MQAKTLLAALLLASAALAMTPSATAIESPPQCQTIGGSCCGIEPAFAPCCSVLDCPPQPHCPPRSFDSSDYIQWAGPWVTVDVGSDCSVQACLQTATCCVIDGRDSRCTTLSAPAAMAGCVPEERQYGPIRTETEHNCHLTIEVKSYDCVWNCGWIVEVEEPVTIRVWGQTGPQESSAASPPNCVEPMVVSEALPFVLTVWLRCGGVWVSVTDPQCPPPSEPGGSVHTDGVVVVYVEGCRLDPECTCDPLPIDLEAAEGSA